MVPGEVTSTPLSDLSDLSDIGGARALTVLLGRKKIADRALSPPDLDERPMTLREAGELAAFSGRFSAILKRMVHVRPLRLDVGL